MIKAEYYIKEVFGMNDFIRKHKRLSIFLFIALLIIIPVIVWLLYPFGMISSGFTAGDIITYIGAIIAGLSTIIGVYLSVQTSQEGYKKDQKGRVLPYVYFNHLHRTSNYDLFLDALFTEDDKADAKEDYKLNYEEFELRKIILDIGDETAFKLKLTEEQEEAVKQKGYHNVIDPSGGVKTMFSNIGYLPIKIENIGNGPAVDFNLSFVSKEFTKDVFLGVLPKDESIYFGIYIDYKQKNRGIYDLRLSYKDILATEYEICYRVYIEKDNVKMNMERGQHLVK